MQNAFNLFAFLILMHLLPYQKNTPLKSTLLFDNKRKKERKKEKKPPPLINKPQ